MSYQHFTTADRYRLYFCLNDGYTLSKTASYIGCSISTIWREIKRNSLTKAELADKRHRNVSLPHNKYHYDVKAAIYKAKKRRLYANQTHNRLAKDTRLRNYIIKHIKERWSPEQIAGVLRKRGVIVKGQRQELSIAVQTIYDYIHHYRPELKKYLRRQKKYKYKWKNYHKDQTRDESRNIDTRPKYIDRRLTIGHWEGDTILGSKQGATGRIATFVERKSGLLIAVKIPSYTTEERKLDKQTRQALGISTSLRFANGFIDTTRRLIQPKYIKTLTLDNGPENADYAHMEQEIPGLEVYFAHPYHSWERGTNENTNGLLRQYFPKGMDFTNITQADIDKAVEEINNRPRKRLNWSTPQDVMERNHVLCTSE